MVRKKVCMYSINYECDNCGCSTTKSYKKGTKAPSNVDCDNCGCKAMKTVGKVKPIEPIIPFPLPEKQPKDKYPPWDVSPYPWDKKPWGEPWDQIGPPYKKQGDWPWDQPKITWSNPSYSSNHYDDGGRIVC